MAQIEDAGMGGNLLGQAIGQFRLAFAGPQADGDRQSQVPADPGPRDRPQFCRSPSFGRRMRPKASSME